MALMNILTPQQVNKPHWGDALGLWDIGRFKVIGITISEIFIAQAKDADLKSTLERGVESLIIPHLEKIQKFMNREGLEVPSVPQRKNLDVVGKQDEPNTYINDAQIADSVREIYRFGLELDMRAVSGSTRDDVRELAWDILTDDYKGYNAMVHLHRKKNWIVAPPTV